MVYPYREATTLNHLEPYARRRPSNPRNTRERRSPDVSHDRRNQLPLFCNRRVAALRDISASARWTRAAASIACLACNGTDALEPSARKEITTCFPSLWPTSPKNIANLVIAVVEPRLR